MENNTSYYPLPQPEEISIREKEDAMGAYLMMFAALGAGLPLPIINLIASVVYFYINKSNSRFVKFHSYQALLSQIPTTLMNAGLIFWSIRIYFSESWFVTDVYKGYIGIVVLANLLYFVFGIVAAIKARGGKMYYLWFFGKLAYQQVFSVKTEQEQSKEVNLPPKI